LYIEALYNVRQRNDSVAITGLQNIISLYPNSPLKDKAENVINVLRRRAEIENYLTNLQVTRATDDSIVVQNDKPIVKAPVAPPVVKDSVKKVVAPLTNGSFTMSVTSPHYVLMILDKVDGVYVNEAKNAIARYNNEKYYGQPIVINKDVPPAISWSYHLFPMLKQRYNIMASLEMMRRMNFPGCLQPNIHS